MFFDPQCKSETKADPLTLTALIAWLETKPAGRRYCYGLANCCLAAQYNEHIGREYVIQGSPFELRNFDEKLEVIAFKGEHTFGAALERARMMGEA